MPPSPPRSLGYRMPAEWAPHRGTWLSWPHKEASWPGKFGPVPGMFAAMVRTLADREEVHINVAGPAMEAVVRPCWPTRAPTRATFLPSQSHQRRLVPRPRPDLRPAARSGRREQAIVDWGYNAWGGKYPPYDLDDVVPTRIGEELGLPVFEPGIVHGGRLDRRERPRHPAHHRGVPAQPQPQSRSSTAREIEQLSRATISACRKILWLGDGIAGDDTDGHVDDLTRFVDPRPSSPSSRRIPRTKTTSRSRRTWSGSADMTDQDGRPLRVVTAADAARPLPRRPAAAGELRELLHRQRRGAATDVRSRSATRKPRPRCRRSFPDRDVDRHRLHRPGLGAGRVPLRHPAVAGLSQDFFQVPTSAARRPPQLSMPTPAMCSSSSVRLTT